MMIRNRIKTWYMMGSQRAQYPLWETNERKARKHQANSQHASWNQAHLGKGIPPYWWSFQWGLAVRSLVHSFGQAWHLRGIPMIFHRLSQWNGWFNTNSGGDRLQIHFSYCSLQPRRSSTSQSHPSWLHLSMDINLPPSLNDLLNGSVSSTWLCHRI